MSKSRSAAQAIEARLDSADRAGRNIGGKRSIGGIELEALYPFWQRVVSLPEPVDTEEINGRAALDWEREYIREARKGERRAELDLLRGLM